MRPNATLEATNEREDAVDAYTSKRIDELASINHGAVKLAGAGLGVETFGMQVLDLPPGFADYPEHDHAGDGQEEVYVVLEGSCDLAAGGQRLALEAGALARVGADTRRSVEPGPEGVRILAIGCSARGPYERPQDFRLAARA
jgi:uncharacterized cupin superfamily protein